MWAPSNMLETGGKNNKIYIVENKIPKKTTNKSILGEKYSFPQHTTGGIGVIYIIALEY